MKGRIDRELAASVLGDPVHWFAFGFGTGLIPLAPGTWGSLLALVIFWMLPPLSLTASIALVAVVCAVGVPICGISAGRLGVHDHGGIVWDEIAGMLLVAAFLPRTLPWLAAAFVAFRVFDIWKPWPIRDLDHSVSGGLGIMLDDVVAAVYALLLLKICQRVFTAL